VTLSTLAQKFLDHKRASRKAARTIDTYSADLVNFLAWLKERRHLDRLSSFRHELLEQHQAHLVQLAYADNTIRRRFTALSSFGRWLVGHDLLRSNPCTSLDLPRPPKRLVRVLADSEMASLLSLPLEPRWDTLRAVLCYGGLRNEEVRNLDLRDIRLDRGLLHVRGKGSKDRLVPMSGQLEAAIRAYLPERADRGPEDPLFPGDVKLRLPAATMARLLTRWGRQIGRPDLHPHLLRHSFATYWLRLGKDLEALRKLLGHESLETTARYLHLVQTDLSESMQDFSYRQGLRNLSQESLSGVVVGREEAIGQ